MVFYADLHVHSKYSRATSRDLDLTHLAAGAARKGIAVLGTGDAVHPGWRAEIGERLVYDGGLFRLTPEAEAAAYEGLPQGCRNTVRFMLTTEISTIYKQDERTRKVHHLILMPDLAAADLLAERLARIGNIASDGRPILGISSRDLLEIVLECHCELIPAHIWTPWFSALGSQSGFDSIDACYGDLSGHIFAVETGLSSDPAMNWRVSALDRFRLISNSDAHSPTKLAREATAFSAPMSYSTMIAALKTGAGYEGTIEFFPEEGKYHLDGHRNCGVRLEPAETRRIGGRCPVCGRPVTVGVAHRVEMLADRAQPQPPATAGAVMRFVPLPEILAELSDCGVEAQKVAHAYARTGELGPELFVLGEMPLEDIARHDPRLGEAIARLRAGQALREGGYDGEYGRVRLFSDAEHERWAAGDMLFAAPALPVRKVWLPEPTPLPAQPPAPLRAEREKAHQPRKSGGVLGALDADQSCAAAIRGPLAVIAGPGAGKTRLIVHRLVHLMAERAVDGQQCLAITFTRRATEELRERINALLPDAPCAIHSFHSLGAAILRAEAGAAGLAPGWRIAGEEERAAALAAVLPLTAAQRVKLIKAVSLFKRTGEGETLVQSAAETLTRLGREQGWIDFDDLVIEAVKLMEREDDVAARWRFAHVVADEFQDIDPWQYRLLRLVAGGGDLCVIGDPDQAIYAFRGADETCFSRFAADYPLCPLLRLTRNYRSLPAIVAASGALFDHPPGEALRRDAGEPVPVRLRICADERSEANFIASRIEDMMGGHDMIAAGRGRGGNALGFADFAVLVRTDALGAAVAEAFKASGIPFQKSRALRLATHGGVAVLLAALEAGDAPLPDRIGAAVQKLSGTADADLAALTEARGWLMALAEDCADEAAWRERVALATDTDFLDPRAERVSLLTMHAAKGLEFPVVFVAGLEEGQMPFAFGGEVVKEDEERRLFYVAMTRARDELILTYARQRFWQGSVRELHASPFLAALEGLYQVDETPPRPVKPLQYSLF